MRFVWQREQTQLSSLPETGKSGTNLITFPTLPLGRFIPSNPRALIFRHLRTPVFYKTPSLTSRDFCYTQLCIIRFWSNFDFLDCNCLNPYHLLVNNNLLRIPASTSPFINMFNVKIYSVVWSGISRKDYITVLWSYTGPSNYWPVQMFWQTSQFPGKSWICFVVFFCRIFAIDEDLRG